MMRCRNSSELPAFGVNVRHLGFR